MIIKTNWFLFLLLVLLAGCMTQPQPQTEISVEMRDHSFSPTSWRVPAGATITLHIVNRDAVAHDWTIIFRQTTHPSDSVDPVNVYWQVAVAPGNSETVRFTAPAAAGDYQIVSSEAEADGMVGKLTVVRIDFLNK